MDKTLVNSSGILYIKSKFFLYRVVSYFSFLLLPILIPKSVELPLAAQAALMILYIMFMVSQWFFLGKEIDHRFKIYFRVNSSMDRVVYRLILGMIFFYLYFNVLSFFSNKWIYNLFWVTWVVLGIFYSWPTRGKIIQETVSSNFTEFRYLDSFEKTLVGLTLVMFAVSIPEFPAIVSPEALMLYFDPSETFSGQFWNFLTVNYFPFRKYPELFKIAWCLHYYIIGVGVFLLVFYAFLRFFVSRRLSLLGLFALISSWSFSKVLAAHYGHSILTTYSLLWIWTTLWVTKSSTYRSGLFLGLVNYLGVVYNQFYFLLIFLQLGLLYGFFLEDKTSWYKKQMVKYSLFGMFFCLSLFLVNTYKYDSLESLGYSFVNEIARFIDRKAVYSLSFIGLIILSFKLLGRGRISREMQLPSERIKLLLSCLGILLGYSILFDKHLLSSFSLLWILSFLSLIPLELLFQGISRLRSRRNMIYLIYILICLLDSHFEGRIKIFLRMFNS
ncbi:MAG: hypothetical protein KC493_03310 [Bacteriovoracaceae bacterium]|nr:hypothetical protein [Bacteriovoracaceae bacterium]